MKEDTSPGTPGQLAKRRHADIKDMIALMATSLREATDDAERLQLIRFFLCQAWDAGHSAKDRE